MARYSSLLGQVLLFFVTLCPLAEAAVPSFHFASRAEAEAALRMQDDFINRLSPFDRSARMKTAQEVSQEAFLDFASQQAKGWTDEEQSQVSSALQTLSLAVKDMQLGRLPEVMLVRTTGLEEGRAAYTRGRCIVLPDSVFSSGADGLAGLLAHEFMHVLSRANPDLRDRLYRVIGFEKCSEVVLPPALARRRITNPDAPVWTHAVRLKSGGQEIWAVPVLVASVSHYPEGATEEFFQFLTLRFKAFQVDATGRVGAPLPALLGLAQLEGFFEKTGRNTGYIIHPEEILADNFKLLITSAADAPSPEILKELDKVLREPHQ